MQGVHVHSRKTSLRNAHVDIETPSWRQYVPNFDNGDETEESDDDNSAAAYINRYHELALDERRKWAGSSSTDPPSAPNGTPRHRVKSSSKRVAPLFPTPTEAFHVVRSALQTFREQRVTASFDHNTSKQQNQLLEQLGTVLTSLANIEESLRTESASLKAVVNASAYHRNSMNGRNRYSQKQDIHNLAVPYPFNTPTYREASGQRSSSIYHQNGTLGTATSLSMLQPLTPPLLSKIPPSQTKHSVAMIEEQARSTVESLEESFRLTFTPLKEQVTRLARRAQISVSETSSFQAINTAISRVLSSQRTSRKDEKGFLSQRNREDMRIFANIIRRSIDSEKYPVLARSFGLDPEYYLNGTHNSLGMIVRDIGEQPGHTQRERRPWEGLFVESTMAHETEHGEKLWDGLPAGRSNRREVSGSVERTVFGRELSETKKVRTFEKDNEVIVSPPTFQASRLEARRKLRQNVKRKLPRIYKERRTRKAFRFRDNAESISSGSSGASSCSPRWNSFREEGVEAMGISRRPSVTVQFQQVVDLEDKEDGTEPSVVYLDDEG